MYVSSSMFFSVFSLSASIGSWQYCHWLSVYRFVFWSAFRFVFLPVSVFAYITANSVCICTSFYSFFSLSLFIFECLYQCPNVLSFILGVYVRSLIRVSLSFSFIVYVCVRLYCHWLYVYRYISYSAFLSISLYLCLSQCPVILSVICMYVNKRFHLSQCVTAF